MRHFTLPLVIAGSILLAALLTWIALSNATFAPRVDARGSRAAATPVTEALPPFTRLDVTGTAHVVLVQGDRESVTYAASGSRAYVSARVRDGTLRLEAGDTAQWWDMLFQGRGTGPAQITVTLKTLESITAAGAVKVTATGLRVPRLAVSGAGGTSVRIAGLVADSLDVDGAGALQAVISGQVGTQKVSISGAGEYDAPDLVSADATVVVAGAGQVVVHATRTLDATISGAGQVEFLGSPQVTEHVSGIGRVKRRGGGGTSTSLAPSNAA